MKVFINIFVCLLFVNSIFTLDVYITPEESSKLLGPINENLYMIKNDVSSPFMRNLQSVISSFRAIPECVDKLTLKWIHEGPQMIKYDIKRIISLNEEKLTVTTNSNRKDFVPRELADLTFNFNCGTATPGVTYSEYVYLEIYLLSDFNEVIYGTPIGVWIQKKCGTCDPTYLRYIPDITMLGITRTPDRCGGCENAWRCARLPGGYSKCKCKRGYTGVRCELPECKPDCQNGGKCISPQKCYCPDLFTGPMCEVPKCNPQCRNGGFCNASNQCSCPLGFSGSACGVAPTVTITSPPVNTTVYSMQAVKFQCRAKGTPKPKFRWLDNHFRPIHPDNQRYRHFKIIVVKSQGYSDLWIYGADVTDAGEYHCIAENQHSMARATATLTVDPYTGTETDLDNVFRGSGSGDFWEDT